MVAGLDSSKKAALLFCENKKQWIRMHGPLSAKLEQCVLGHEEGHEQLDDTNDEQNDALRKRERVGLSGGDHHGAVEQIEVAASDAAGSWAGRLPADSAAGWGRQQAPCEAQGAWRATAGGAPELTMCA